MAETKQFWRRAGSVLTTDASSALLVAVTIPVLTTGMFNFRVTGKNPTDGTLMYSCCKEGTFSRGGVTLIQPSPIVALAEFVNSLLGTILGGVGTTVSISGGDLQVRVVGKAATSVQWRGNLWVYPN